MENTDKKNPARDGRSESINETLRKTQKADLELKLRLAEM